MLHFIYNVVGPDECHTDKQQFVRTIGPEGRRRVAPGDSPEMSGLSASPGWGVGTSGTVQEHKVRSRERNVHHIPDRINDDLAPHVMTALKSDAPSEAALLLSNLQAFARSYSPRPSGPPWQPAGCRSEVI